jgi:hypothetical protein
MGILEDLLLFSKGSLRIISSTLTGILEDHIVYFDRDPRGSS